MLVDGVADVLRQRDVPVVAFLAELHGAEPGLLVDLLVDAQDGAVRDPAAPVDGERFADAQAAPVHQPYGGRPVRGKARGQRFGLGVRWQDEVFLDDDAGKFDRDAGGFGELLVPDGFAEDALMTRWAARIRLALRPLARMAAIRVLMSSRRTAASRLPPIAGST